MPKKQQEHKHMMPGTGHMMKDSEMGKHMGTPKKPMMKKGKK